MRPCDIFLQQRCVLLGEYGYDADWSSIETTPDSWFVFYHYTREQNLSKVFDAGGLYARLPVVSAEHIPQLKGHYLVEGLLQPLPGWMESSKYFGDLCLSMMRQYVGDLLLRITVPPDFPNIYVADMAHNFESKYWERHGETPLNLGYDCQTGHEVTLAEANSYIPLHEYKGGHILPNVKITRCGEGLVIPNRYINVCEEQPLRLV